MNYSEKLSENMSSLRKSQIHASFAYIHRRHLSGRDRIRDEKKLLSVAMRSSSLLYALCGTRKKQTTKCDDRLILTAKLNLVDRLLGNHLRLCHTCVCLCLIICNCIENHKTLSVTSLFNCFLKTVAYICFKIKLLKYTST